MNIQEEEIIESVNDMFVKLLGRNVNLDEYLLLCSHDKHYVDELLKILKIKNWKQIVDQTLYNYIFINCKKWYEAFAISIDTVKLAQAIEEAYNQKFIDKEKGEE